MQQAIEAATKLQELEDLYLPYRPKKRTRASIARERGLEPLAKLIWEQTVVEGDPLTFAESYVTEEVETAEAALQGAQDIVAEEISDRADFRAFLRERFVRDGSLETVLVEEDEESKFQQYAEYSERMHIIPPHRMLAVNRGESLGALKVSMKVPVEKYISYMLRKVTTGNSIFSPYLEAAVTDAYKRLISPAIEREVRKELTEQAEEQAIRVFGVNLKNLLMQAPLAGQAMMGLDPGYRTGCKMAIIDHQGNVLDYGTYYLTHSENQALKAQKELAAKIREFNVTLISIGNGTASYETEQFVSRMLGEEKLDAQYIVTNEAGASVYSASKLAIEELPDLDVSIRGAVSIARRVQDPLAEFVKIDPKSIGIGQYQHDVNQKRLAETLDNVVEQVVNYVGVELNTASPAIMEHVAGISGTVAKNIWSYRKENGPFTSRKELLKVARLGPSAFTQSAGFFRIQGATNPLDNTSVHPESYELAEKVVESLGFTIADLSDKTQLVALQEKIATVEAEQVANALDAGVPTVRDILESLAKPGRDPREDLPLPVTRKHVVSLEELPVGTIVRGTVTNVVDFGAFLDIGLKENGLLHRSELCKSSQHPSAVVAVGDVLEVEIISIDVKRKRIGLSRKSIRERNRALEGKN